MNLDVEKELIEKHPKLFANVGQPMSCMNFGIECGSGWESIIRSVCWCLEDRAVRFDQIKEKWGALRIYFTASEADDGFTAGVIRMAEAMSRVTCERCGAAGRIREGGWLMCLCDSCLEKKS